MRRNIKRDVLILISAIQYSVLPMNTDNRREVVQFKEWLNSGERVGKAYKRGKIDKKIKNILF